jgi:hypothetical protein
VLPTSPSGLGVDPHRHGVRRPAIRLSDASPRRH